MSLRHDSIDVRVSQRILWFGNEAYALPNITRTNFGKLVPNRGAAIRGHVRTVLLTLFGAGVLAALVPPTAAALIVVCALAFLGYKTYKLVEFLKIELYELVIETAAGSHRGLISNNGGVVIDLSRRIAEAINNPHAEFQMRVENVQVGDNFNNFGGINTNTKVTR